MFFLLQENCYNYNQSTTNWWIQTWGWMYRMRRLKVFSPPQTAAPCLCMVARYVPKGDHCTKLSVQNCTNQATIACLVSVDQFIQRSAKIVHTLPQQMHHHFYCQWEQHYQALLSTTYSTVVHRVRLPLACIIPVDFCLCTKPNHKLISTSLISKPCQ